MVYTVKNQNTIKEGYRNDCTIYAATTLLELQFWLNIKYWLIEKLASIAFIDKVLTLWGAAFWPMYKYIARKISVESWMALKSETCQVRTKKFEKAVNLGYYFATGLIYGNDEYKACVERWIITKKDIDNIRAGRSRFTHANVFWKSKDGTHTSIFEVLRGKEVICDIETLKYWVKKGVFWDNSRTFFGANRLASMVCTHLIQMERQPKKHTKLDSAEKRITFHKAKEILSKYK